MADIEYSTRAADWLRDTEPDIRERVMSKLEQAAEWPDHFLDALSGVPYYKLRVGDYRAIIDWRRDDDVLFVRYHEHRSRKWKPKYTFSVATATQTRDYLMPEERSAI